MKENLGNFLGSLQDLIELCDKAKSVNLKIIVDVVFNHF